MPECGSKFIHGLALVLWLIPGTPCTADSLVSSGRASFVPPPDCQPVALDGQMVQACGIEVEQHHSILITLREAWEKTGARDSKGIAKAMIRAELWPDEYADGLQEDLRLVTRETLRKFRTNDAEQDATPAGAAKCVQYSYLVEDRQVPKFAGRLFVRQEIGLLCAAGVPGKDAMYVHQTWLSVSERFSPALKQKAWAETDALTRGVMSSLDIGDGAAQ